MEEIRKWVVVLLWAAATLGEAQAQNLIVGAGPSGGPRVRVFDDVSPVNQAADFFAFDANSSPGVSVALGDVNGDGRLDRIVGTSSGSSRVRVFSGSDNAVLADFLAFDAAFTGGVQVAAGDVNNDGRPDIVVGTASGAARVRVFSGADTTQVLLDFLPFGQQASMGVSVAAGEFSGDSNADIVVGAGPQFAPMVRLFDGRDATVLNTLFPLGQQLSGGVNVAAGDVNGDGRDDLIAAVASQDAPRVVAVNTVSQQTIFDFLAFDAAFTGGVRVAAADFDADGRADVVAGVGPGSGPRLRVFSGTDTAQVLADFLGFDASFQGGIFVGAAEAPPTPAQPGQLRFSSASYSQSESGPQATITVERVNGADGAASVAFATQPGSAGSADFTAVSGSLNWQDGDAAAKTFQVPITDDSLDEPDETVLLTLSNATGATLGQAASATLSIVDNDEPPPPPQFALDAASYQVNETDGTLVITIRRLGDTSGSASVRLRTISGTAQAGEDFTAIDSVQNWPAGDATPRTVSIPITDDTLLESVETLSLELTVLTGGSLSGPGTATVRIVSNEAPAEVRFSQAEYPVPEGGGTVTLELIRSGDTGSRVQLDFRSFSGSGDGAEPALDYVATNGTLVFEAGETRKTVVVSILDDTIIESDERFSLLLENPSQGLLIPESRGRVRIIDDEQTLFDGIANFGGALNPALLLPLMLFALLRRRGSRRVAAWLLVLGITGAQAAPAPYYLGGHLGTVNAALDSAELSRELQAAGHAVSARIDSDQQLTWGLLAGWRAWPRLAFEAEYRDLGRFEARLSGNSRDAAGIARAIADGRVGSGHAFMFNLRGDVPLAERLSLSPSVGMMGWLTDVRVTGSNGQRDDARANGFGLLCGLGLNVPLGRSLSVGLDAQWLRPGSGADQQTYAARLEWNLGD